MSEHSEHVSIDFSVEELVAVTQLLDLRSLPGLDDDIVPPPSDPSRGAVLDAARRALVARRVVHVDAAGGVTVVPAVAKLVQLASGPGLVARVQHERGGLVETCVFSAVPDVAVERRPMPGSIHRLTPFATEELLVRMLERCRFEERPAVNAEPFTLTLAELIRAAELVASGDRTAAEKIFATAGASPFTATAFASALATKVGSSRVTLLHRPDETHLEGGDLTWLDAGDAGIWLTPTPDTTTTAVADGDGTGAPDLDVPLTVTPTTAQAIAAELLSYLPSASD